MKIAVAGAAGRMGQMLIREIARTEGASLAAALEGPGSNQLGTEAAKGVKIVADAARSQGLAQVGGLPHHPLALAQAGLQALAGLLAHLAVLGLVQAVAIGLVDVTRDTHKGH